MCRFRPIWFRARNIGLVRSHQKRFRHTRKQAKNFIIRVQKSEKCSPTFTKTLEISNPIKHKSFNIYYACTICPPHHHHHQPSPCPRKRSNRRSAGSLARTNDRHSPTSCPSSAMQYCSPRNRQMTKKKATRTGRLQTDFHSYGLRFRSHDSK
jgi:hypothetical protein